jgi:hypothetical protein
MCFLHFVLIFFNNVNKKIITSFILKIQHSSLEFIENLYPIDGLVNNICSFLGKHG